MARSVCHVVHKKADGRWRLEEHTQSFASFESKSEAADAGKQRVPDMPARWKGSQFVIRLEDGSIETEHTYGRDRRSTPG